MIYEGCIQLTVVLIFPQLTGSLLVLIGKFIAYLPAWAGRGKGWKRHSAKSSTIQHNAVDPAAHASYPRETNQEPSPQKKTLITSSKEDAGHLGLSKAVPEALQEVGLTHVSAYRQQLWGNKQSFR